MNVSEFLWNLYWYNLHTYLMKHIHNSLNPITDLEKTKPMNSAELFFFGFFEKLVNFSANFGSLNVKIWNNSKNVIFIACKRCKICIYYVYSMVISLLPVKRKKKNEFWLNIWFLLFCRDFKFVVIHACFLPNLYFQNFRVHKKMFFFSSLPKNSQFIFSNKYF